MPALPGRSDAGPRLLSKRIWERKWVPISGASGDAVGTGRGGRPACVVEMLEAAASSAAAADLVS